MTRQECLQELYEEVLGSHWKKLHQIVELVETSSGSYLRMKSIADRRAELAAIENKKLVLEQLADELLLVPEWYTTRLKEVDNDYSNIQMG